MRNSSAPLASRGAGRLIVVVVGAGFVALSAVGSPAETLPHVGSVDPRIRTALYNPDEVYRLVGFVGYDIELILEGGEHFTARAGGDLEALAIDAFENHVHIKPRSPVVSTNLVIYTDRRAYRIAYSASARAPHPSTDEIMYAVRFSYPPAWTSAQGPSAAQEVDRAFTEAKAQPPRNIDYWYCGSPSIRPVAASDDGVHTRLTFAAKAELPALFVRNDDGSESLLNFSLDAGDVVIHRIAPRFILRRGHLTGCIVNKGFVGSSDRLSSGTVTPQVERDRKGLRP